MGDGPDEAGQLAGDGGDGHGLPLAGDAQGSIAQAQPVAGLVGDGDQGRRPVGLAVRWLGRAGVGPGGLDQGLAGAVIAGLGQPALPALLAGGVFADGEPEEGLEKRLTSPISATTMAALSR